MIISHQYRFIFLRTEKTASSSLTHALREALGGKGDQVDSPVPNALQRKMPFSTGGLKRRMPSVFGLHTHARAAHVRRVLGAGTFDSYFKFAVERNPWDRQVSLYLHRAAKEGLDPEGFDRAMQSAYYNLAHYNRLDNWSVYAIGDEIVADEVIRYESLSDRLPGLFKRLGLPKVDLPRLRAGHRPDRRHYTTYYSDKSRDLVSRWYRREIDAFGFRFEAEPMVPETPSAAQAAARG